jgi:CBS domain-containing protein
MRFAFWEPRVNPAEGEVRMRLDECMTKGVECTRPSATLEEAARKMRDLDVGTLPVCGEDDRLVGIVTDRDITVRAVAEGRDPRSTLVDEAMTRTVVTCYEDQALDEAARLMEDRQIRRLPVLDRDHRLAGILSLGDLAVSGINERELAAEALEAISTSTPR